MDDRQTVMLPPFAHAACSLAIESNKFLNVHGLPNRRFGGNIFMCAVPKGGILSLSYPPPLTSTAWTHDDCRKRLAVDSYSR